MGQKKKNSIFLLKLRKKNRKLKLQGGVKKIVKNVFNLCCKGVTLGFTRVQFFQHMFLKKKKKNPVVIPF